MPIQLIKVPGKKKDRGERIFSVFCVFLATIQSIYYRNHADRQRHHLGVPNQQLADIFHKRLSEFDDHRIEESNRVKRSEGSLMLRPVGGPMNIEQLPAMLAARYVKRYPYSQQDDPEIM